MFLAIFVMQLRRRSRERGPYLSSSKETNESHWSPECFIGFDCSRSSVWSLATDGMGIIGWDLRRQNSCNWIEAIKRHLRRNIAWYRQRLSAALTKPHYTRQKHYCNEEERIFIVFPVLYTWYRYFPQVMCQILNSLMVDTSLSDIIEQFFV